jgi:hypothetical protein
MTVESWGIGSPDFGGKSTRTQLGDDQTPVTIGAAIDLDPGVLSLSVYQVPVGKRFILGYIKSSASIDGIMRGDFMKNGVSFCPLQAPQMVIDQLPETSGFVFDAGDVLGFTGTNPHLVPVTITVCLSGFLYPSA